jgi:hypothetical protein
MLAFMHAFKSAVTRDTARPVSSAFIKSLIDQGVDMLAEVCYQVMRIFDVRHAPRGTGQCNPPNLHTL